MREFKLINSIGAELDLMDTDNFFSSPSGLGFEHDLEYVSAGYSFLETDDQLSQKVISGEIVFKGYTEYTTFLDFATPPLTFCYKPSSTWFYITCKIQKLGKSEIKDHKLICPVDFICTGTWYKALTVQQTELDEDIGKIYPYTYDYTYAETAAGSAEFNNTGLIPSPCKIHIMGEVINPSWSLIQGGVVLATGQVNTTIVAGNKLVIDSSPGSMEIAEYSTSDVYVQNRYSSSDFSTERFILIPVGISTLTFTHAGTNIIDAFVEVRQLAEGV
jgi:hypothetical protein